MSFEASLYDQNSFITLTYSDQFLPTDLSLNVRHAQLFLKKLRNKFNEPIRFYLCGEYGEKTLRPHYHLILFNGAFSDATHFKTVNGNRYYTSELLNSTWAMGHCIIGDVTFDSCAYCARYITKKIHGKTSTFTRIRPNPDGPGFIPIRSEFSTQSRNPGIARAWYDRYKKDVYPHDYVVHEGREMRPPRAFDRFLELDEPELLASLKEARIREAARHAANNTDRRLRDREEVKIAQITTLRRGLQ